jgi:hypothetical protein
MACYGSVGCPDFLTTSPFSTKKSEFRTSRFLLIHHLQVRFKGRCLIKTGHPPAWMPGVLWWNLREPPRNKPNRSLRGGIFTFNWNSPEHISNISYISPYIHWHSDWNGKSISKLPSGNLTCGKSPCIMSKSTISIDSMAMFNSFFYVYQAGYPQTFMGQVPSNRDVGSVKLASDLVSSWWLSSSASRLPRLRSALARQINGHDSGTEWLEVPTIYTAYVLGLFFREYPHKIWPYMVKYLHLLDPAIPIEQMWNMMENDGKRSTNPGFSTTWC